MRAHFNADCPMLSDVISLSTHDLRIKCILLLLLSSRTTNERAELRVYL